MAQPNAGGAVDGGDRHCVLGELTVSGADEAILRGDPGEGSRGIDLWSGVSVGPNDAVAGKSMADDGELAGRESDWDDVFVFVWAGGVGVSGHGATAADRLEIFEYVIRSGGGNADGRVHELRGSDCARAIRGGNEQGIGAGGNVRFSGFECSGAGDDVCIVSGADGLVEAGDGSVLDFCICTGGGVTQGRQGLYVPDRDSDDGKLAAGNRDRSAVVR